MPLLVQDRGKPDVLERVPPWGDPDLSSYLQKFDEVFDSLEEHPSFRMDFEISAREMEDVAQENPQIVERMRKFVSAGKLGLVGGDYSQAHYHVYGTESCLRQLSLGLEVFRRIFGCSVDVFFHQETGIHEQLPQVLKAFGYKVAVPPRFPWAIRFLEGESPELTSHYGTLFFVNGDEFTYWQGLDGSRIPLYLSIPAPSQSDEIIEVFQKHGNPEVRREIFDGGPSPYDQFMELERQKNPVTVPPILIENPDMKRLDRGYFEKRSEHCRFALMREALEQRLRQVPPRSAATLYAYWSYIEGVWAERLSRMNKKAEQVAIQAEALYWMSRFFAAKGEKDSRSTDSGTQRMQVEAKLERIWKLILSSQHHDVYWIETTDIKHRALGWLDEAIQSSDELADSAMKHISGFVDTSEATKEDTLLVFNTTPHRRSGTLQAVISIEENAEVQLTGLGGNEMPCQAVTIKAGDEVVSRRLLLNDTVPGLGYTTYLLGSGGAPRSYTAFEGKVITFENDIFRIEVNRNATVRSLYMKEAGKELFSTNQYLANEIRGLVHGTDWIGNRDADALVWYQSGMLADVLMSEYQMGPIRAWQHILLYKSDARIDFYLTLDFGDEGIAVGDFWNDAEKLNVYWPLTFRAQVFHDIPFGVVPAREKRPLYCTNWIDGSDGEVGLCYLNKGTTKHWLQGNTIADVLAWGGNWFSNRHPGIWEYVRKYDIRLFGMHTIEYSIYVHSGDWREARVPLFAENASAPLRTVQAKKREGTLAGREGIAEIDASNIIFSAFTRDSDSSAPFCRGFESHGEKVGKKNLGVRSDLAIDLHSLKGGSIRSVRPYQIFEMRLPDPEIKERSW
jgi:alpha-mannosidase